VYFAIHNSIVPLISSVFVLIFGVISGILLTNYFSNFYEFSILKITFDPSYFFNRSDGPLAVGGLALSSSLVFSAEFFLLLFILRYKKVITNLRGLGKEMIVKLFATLTMMSSAYIMAKVWEGILQTDKTVQLIVLTATTALTAFVIYLITCKLLRVEEVNVFMRFLIRTIKKLNYFKG
ncbi:hypothetical protein KC675_05405, partial [Candidatus Dojkabacteria bacterium]|nr:hypothetical protein [Candidatus Dojkabacteria bacterium]